MHSASVLCLLLVACAAAQQSLGQQLWYSAMEQPTSGSTTPLILGNSVFVVDINVTVYKLDLSTGRQVWAQTTSLQEYGVPTSVIAGTTTVAIVGTQYFAVFDARTGKLLWSEIASISASDVVFTSGGHYVLPGSSEADTTIVLERSGLVTARLPAASQVLVMSTFIVLINSSGAVQGYSEMGVLQFTFTNGNQLGCSALYSVAGGVVASCTGNAGGSSVAVALSSSGQILWQTNMPNGLGTVAVSGTTFVSFAQSATGEIGATAINGLNGQTVWQIDAINVSATSVGAAAATSSAAGAICGVSDSHAALAVIDSASGQVTSFTVVPTYPSSYAIYASKSQFLVPNLEGVIGFAAASGSVSFDTAVQGPQAIATGNGVAVVVGTLGVAAIKI